MRNIQIQQPYFQNPKTTTYTNQMNPIIQQNPSKNVNIINLQTTSQIIPNNKRYNSPLPMNRIDGNHFTNGINLPKISHINSYTSQNAPALLKSQYYIANQSNNLNNMIQSHNVIPGTIITPNLVTNLPTNQSTIKPINGTIINNNNQMNDITTNQNIINLINNNTKKANLNNNITITTIGNPNIINNQIPNIRNNPVSNPNVINNLAPNLNTIKSSVPNINIINNAIPNPPNIIQNPIINNPPINQNLINDLSSTIRGQNYNLIPTINNFGNGVNNGLSFVPKVEISLVGQKPFGQQPSLINNNILPMNNLREPSESINLSEFQILKEIGQGTFGIIYKVLWIVNNKIYALKKEILKDMEGVKARLHRNETIRNFIKQTNCMGVVSLYGNLTIPRGREFEYYELMEMCDMDFEQEIKSRSAYNRFYSQQEMFGVMLQLISTLSFLQKCHITHRDIKPQNILISKGVYKLCDFGDIRKMQREGIVVQRVRGSELYMSPILFNGLRSKQLQVRHNTYKSDVFSLGMCFLLAACLSYDGLVEIRELSDMNQKDMILNKYLLGRYSPNLVRILHFMLQTEEVNRPDFILLESLIRQYGI